MSNYIQNLRKLVGHRPLIMCAAGVILIDELGRILLQRRTDNGTWGFPGGALEPGETLEEAASREVFEETGLTVRCLQFFGMYSGEKMYHVYPNADEVYIVSVVFVTGNYQGELCIDDLESQELQFFEVDHLPEKVNPPDKVLLADLQERYSRVLELAQLSLQEVVDRVI